MGMPTNDPVGSPYNQSGSFILGVMISCCVSDCHLMMERLYEFEFTAVSYVSTTGNEKWG
jgi:hypothetical protein